MKTKKTKTVAKIVNFHEQSLTLREWEQLMSQIIEKHGENAVMELECPGDTSGCAIIGRIYKTVEE